MLKQISIAALGVALAACPVLADDGGLPSPAAVAAPVGKKLAPVYRPYFYNYPHAIPPDYVFRTGRVFSPNGMEQAMSGLSAGAVGPDVLAGQGEALKDRILELGRMLLANATEDIRDEYAITVSTFVNLNNLYATSSLGRYLGEQLITGLSQSGLEVVEVRKTPGIMMSERHGEYGLSRDMDELSFVQHAQAMVVGTYTVSGNEIFINARLLRNEDNMVLAGASMTLPVNTLTARLLADEGMPVAVSAAQVTLRALDEK